MFVHVTPGGNKIYQKLNSLLICFAVLGGGIGELISLLYSCLYLYSYTGYLYICICILFIFTVFVFVFIHRVFVFLYFIPQLAHFRTQGDNSQARIQCQH